MTPLSGSLIELVIGTSIVFVAVQNIFWPPSAQGSNQMTVAFFFGLFHGLGFAGGLLALMQQLPKATALAAMGDLALGSKWVIN